MAADLGYDRPVSERWVVLDVGETLIDETRVWSTWADELGVPRLTFLAALGAVIERGGEHVDVFTMLEGLETVGVIRTVDSQSDIIVVEEFGDARILADRIRDRVPVVLDMRRADHDLVRRVVDFSSGLIYALDGSMRKVGDGLVMVLPPRVTLSRDEKRRLSTLGAYELDDVDD